VLGTAPIVRDGRPLVLIVDDSRSIQRILAEALEDDYNIAFAFDGADGIRQAEALRPDLVLADLVMPEVDGTTMIRTMRQRPVLAEVPILVLTSKRDPKEELALLASGVQDFIHKPFLLPEVRCRVKNLVAAKRVRDLLGGLVDRQQTDIEKLAADVARQQRDLCVAIDQAAAARAAAERASEVKTNFLRTMSHELKTPITAMQLHLHLLRRAPALQTSSALSEGVERISVSSQRLFHLAETMLEWARVDQATCLPERQPFDLAAMLTDVAEELAGYARLKHLELLVDTAPMPLMNSDRRLLRLVLVNLTSRAIKLSERGTVELHARYERGAFRISVRDAGAPLSPVEQHELFEPIPAGQDSRWRGGAGSGLGLHVIRDVARALSGDVVLERVADYGNVLTVLVDATPAPRHDRVRSHTSHPTEVA
jgi:signal transduction histidine kinase